MLKIYNKYVFILLKTNTFIKPKDMHEKTRDMWQRQEGLDFI
jgi:hypothetical protein